MSLLKNLAAYDTLDPTQAVALVGVLELYAAWDALRGRPADDPRTAARQLLAIQQKFEAYRAGRAGYAARYHTDHVPTLAPGGPVRLANWCRAVRAVLQRADGGPCPAALLTRVHHLAGQIANQAGCEPVARSAGPATAAEAVRELDGLIDWCDERAKVPAV